MNAIVWAALILGLAVVLRGSHEAGGVVVLTSGAAATSVTLLSARARGERRECDR